MTENNPTSGPQNISLRQDQETGVREIVAGNFRLRYLYARSSDCRQSDDPGQDYVTLRQDGRRLAFALCDGVSQSFYGDLAARLLGDALVEWLWDRLPAGEFQREPIRQALHDYLTDLTDEATRQVRRIPIPADAPPLLRDALEQKRAIGSEATFVCGTVEMPGPNLPHGRVVLAWLGDAELQLWGKERDRTGELGAEWIEARRWSTKVGPKGGTIGVFVGRIEDVRRVLAYSDGIASLRERLGRGIGDSELAREVERLGEMPTSDDVSFLEIEVLPEPVAATGPVTVPVAVAPPPASPPVHPFPRHAPPVRTPPLPRARPWLVYAGAAAALVILCLLGALIGRQLLGGVEVTPFQTATFAPTALPAIATPKKTVTPTSIPGPTATSLPAFDSPQGTPAEPTSPLPTPSPPTVSTQTPLPKSVPSLSLVPPHIAPVEIEGEETSLEGAMVVVGGTGLHIEEDLYSVRVAQREVPGSEVRFPRQNLPPKVSLDQVQWVWLIYRPQEQPKPVVPVLLTLVLQDGQELPWGGVDLPGEQETWVYGVDSQAGLCHFLAQGCPAQEADAPVLVRGSWHQHEGNWKLQATEWYRFDQDRNIYVSTE